MSEIENAIRDSLPEPTEQAASSPAGETPPQVEAPAEATAQKAEPKKEEPFNEHPRFKELIAEKNSLQQQNQQLMELLQKSQSPPPTGPSQPPEQMTPEEKAFWDKNRQFLQKESEPLVQELRKEIQETKQIQAALLYQNFQFRHPDVTPGSDIETKIAELYRKGVDLDTAYEVASTPIKAQKEIERIKQSQQVKTQQKIAANVETTSVSPSAIPEKEPTNFRDKLRQSFVKAGF